MSTEYDPKKIWYLSRDAKPPYERSQIRLSLPKQLTSSIQRFLYNDPAKTFISIQQVLLNAVYHGFHHMEEVQGITDLTETVEIVQSILKDEEDQVTIKAKAERLTMLKELWQQAGTLDREKLRVRVMEDASVSNDPQYAQKLLDIVR